MKILVTGGTGYIGSHTVVELLEAGYDTVVLDNLCNSSLEALNRVKTITGKDVTFYNADIRDEEALRKIFNEERPDTVIHFAGLKAVGESVQIPLAYFDNNIAGTVTMLRVMKETGCRNIVFSSSATVYGKPESVPIREDFPLSATNPYGRTKLVIEQMLGDLYTSENLNMMNPIKRSGSLNFKNSTNSVVTPSYNNHFKQIKLSGVSNNNNSNINKLKTKIKGKKNYMDNTYNTKTEGNNEIEMTHAKNYINYLYEHLDTSYNANSEITNKTEMIINMKKDIENEIKRNNEIYKSLILSYNDKLKMNNKYKTNLSIF